jgi:catalase
VDPHKPAKVVKDVVEAAAAKIADVLTPPVPGAPGSAPPPVDEPTAPREPLPPKKEHGAPEARTPTGALDAGNGQQGAFLTTAQGARLRDTDHSLKAGPRGPILLQDHHFREKITHFDHERIPERVVHARGAGAHGVFTGYGTADELTRAGFL